MERADEIESKTPPSGIGGLLVFFIFGLFGNAAFNAFKAVKILLSSPSPIAYIDVLLDLALAGLAFFAAVQLVRVKDQGISALEGLHLVERGRVDFDRRGVILPKLPEPATRAWHCQ